MVCHIIVCLETKNIGNILFLFFQVTSVSDLGGSTPHNDQNDEIITFDFWKYKKIIFSPSVSDMGGSTPHNDRT